MINQAHLKQIIIFTDRYPYGKSESFFENELAYLAKQYEQVILFPIDSANNNFKRQTPGNVVIIKPVYFNFKSKKELIRKGICNSSPILPFIIEFFKSNCWKSANKTWNLIAYGLVSRALLNAFSKEQWQFEKSSVLYFYWGLRWSQVLPFLPLNFEKKILIRFHGSDLYEYTNHNYIPFRDKQVRRADWIAFISEMGRKYLIERYPSATSKSSVERLGTKDYGLNPYHKTAKIHLVSCSNMVALKRLHLIVESLAFFDVPVKWTHLGDGPLFMEIKKAIESLPSSIQIDLVGAKSHSDLMMFYKSNSIDLFVNVSSSEGVPVSVMEALSFGIPVIATDVGGTQEIVDNTVGSLVDANITPEALVIEIKKCLNNPDYMDLKKNARTRWEQMSNEEILIPNFFKKLASL
jgi:Glycosyltransferase